MQGRLCVQSRAAESSSLERRRGCAQRSGSGRLAAAVRWENGMRFFCSALHVCTTPAALLVVRLCSSPSPKHRKEVTNRLASVRKGAPGRSWTGLSAPLAAPWQLACSTTYASFGDTHPLVLARASPGRGLTSQLLSGPEGRPGWASSWQACWWGGHVSIGPGPTGPTGPTNEAARPAPAPRPCSLRISQRHASLHQS